MEGRAGLDPVGEQEVAERVGHPGQEGERAGGGRQRGHHGRHSGPGAPGAPGPNGLDAHGEEQQEADGPGGAGEEAGCRLFRKVAAWYAKRLGPVVEFRRRLALLRTRAGFYTALAAYQAWRTQFCDARGELLPKYRQQKLVASFMRPEADSPPGAVRVPKGPVEVW